MNTIGCGLQTKNNNNENTKQLNLDTLALKFLSLISAKYVVVKMISKAEGMSWWWWGGGGKKFS